MEDIICLKKQIITQPNYSPKYDVIMDFRIATLDFEIVDLDLYTDFANNCQAIIGERKTGFLTSKPKQVALSTIFATKKGNLPIDSQTFSTLNGLINWLNQPLHTYDVIEEKLQELKQ